MKAYRLKITLKSDATFGRGDGMAGVVDVEVQHDGFGLPFLSGRTLKGLLGAECADILFALQYACPPQTTRWTTAANRLFGASGGNLSGEGNLIVGSAVLPQDLRDAIGYEVESGNLTQTDILETFTALRRQTAMDAETGAPKKETLRTMRVILRETIFEAPLDFRKEPEADELSLLSAAIKAFRRAGSGRNRGRGRLTAELCDGTLTCLTDIHFSEFRKAVAG